MIGLGILVIILAWVVVVFDHAEHQRKNQKYSQEYRDYQRKLEEANK